MTDLRRRDVVLGAVGLTLAFAGTVQAGAVQAQGGANACVANTAHDDRLRALLAEVKAGTATAEVTAEVAANRCPVCGCSLTNPFTGRPAGSKLF